jgi:hypothetical protein
VDPKGTAVVFDHRDSDATDLHLDSMPVCNTVDLCLLFLSKLLFCSLYLFF